MCLFCKIVEKDIPSEFIYEDDYIIAIKDINPKAKTHLLFIPKIHQENILNESDESIIQLFSAVRKFVFANGLDKSGCKIQLNNGAGAGQEVFHTHLHLLSNSII